MTDQAAYINRLLCETREELSRADNKASILLGATAVTVGVVITSMFSGDARIERLTNSVEWACWMGAAAVVLGLAQLGRAVTPAHLEPNVQRAAFFTDFAACASPSDLAEHLADTNDARAGRDLGQLHTLSGVVARKYRLIRSATQLLGFGVGLTIVSVVVDYAIR